MPLKPANIVLIVEVDLETFDLLRQVGFARVASKRSKLVPANFD